VKLHLLLVSALVALAGCAMSVGVQRVALPQNYQGETARVKATGAADIVTFFAAGVPHCHIGSVDGVKGYDDFIMAPGKHVLISARVATKQERKFYEG
jgi:hypothetical protein